jgi:hypothetical protein
LFRRLARADLPVPRRRLLTVQRFKSLFQGFNFPPLLCLHPLESALQFVELTPELFRLILRWGRPPRTVR